MARLVHVRKVEQSFFFCTLFELDRLGMKSPRLVLHWFKNDETPLDRKCVVPIARGWEKICGISVGAISPKLHQSLLPALLVAYIRALVCCTHCQPAAQFFGKFEIAFVRLYTSKFDGLLVRTFYLSKFKILTYLIKSIQIE